MRDRHQPAIAKSQKQEHGTRCDALFRSIRLMGFTDYGLELLRRACAGRKGKSRPVSFGHITISTLSFADLYFLAVRGIKHP